MPSEIPLFEQGESPGPWSAERMNALVRHANAWRNAAVKPDGAGKVILSDSNVIIEIGEQQSTGSVSDVAVWVAGTDADPAVYSVGQIRVIPGLSASCGTYYCTVAHSSTDASPHEPSTDVDHWLLMP